jgi:imidazoleglycerol phosphate dehydratase HisB
MTVAGTRRAERQRRTKETTIEVAITIDGTGSVAVSTGLPFFDHMLSQLGRHGGFDLSITAEGDLAVDAHHTVEDVGIVLGEAFAEALGTKMGIRRFSSIALPLDEALVDVALDLSGRAYLAYVVPLAGRHRRVGIPLVRPTIGGGVLACLRHGCSGDAPRPDGVGQEHPPHPGGLL